LPKWSDLYVSNARDAVFSAGMLIVCLSHEKFSKRKI